MHRRILFDKLEFNAGMLVENVVAQMLTANGRKLYFHMQKSKDEAKNRLEVDFLIAKSRVQRRKNISPIEVKGGKNYTLGSLSKCCEKYGQYIDVPYVLHSKDVKVENGITYLPVMRETAKRRMSMPSLGNFSLASYLPIRMSCRRAAETRRYLGSSLAMSVLCHNRLWA